MKTLTLHNRKITIMGIPQIRELLHEYINQADERFIQLVYGMVQADIKEGDYQLSVRQQEELDRRLEKYENEEMKFSSWDTVKDRIRNRVKSGL